MVSSGVTVTVPGKIMLAGEYGVLWGAPSLSCALDRTLTVQAEVREAGSIELHSPLWPDPLLTTLTRYGEAAAHEQAAFPLWLQATCAALACYPQLGLCLRVSADFPISAGLGSSSALCLATMLAAASLAGKQRENSLRVEGRPSRSSFAFADAQEFFLAAGRQALAVQRSAQGFASGYDIATQLRGGLVVFRHDEHTWPKELRVLPEEARGALSSLVGIYTAELGGAPTTTVGGAMSRSLIGAGKVAKVCALSEEVVAALLSVFAGAESTLDEISWKRFFLANAELRLIFAEGPAFPQRLMADLATLPGFDRRWTAKPSGAGGNDGFIVFAPVSADREAAHRLLLRHGWQRLTYAIAPSWAGARVCSSDTGSVVQEVR